MSQAALAPARALPLERIEEIYESGRYTDAFDELAKCGGLRGQTDVHARLLGARIAMNVGAERLSRLIILDAHRRAPADPEAVYYFASELAEVRGLFCAVEMLEGFGVPPGADDQLRALLLLRRASFLAILRDFQVAQSLAEQAAAVWDHPWLWVERSFIALQADRVDEAERAAERALVLGPTYRPSLQCMAQVLTVRGARAEAAALLSARASGLQSAALLHMRAQLHYDLERVPEALDDLIAGVAFLRSPDLPALRRIASLATGIHYKLGNLPVAASLARMAGTPIHDRLAERLERGRPARRVLLPVPYVRQDNKTCAPATLTSLCHFHGRTAEHVAIVEEICYDGTPAASERRWAEEHGLAARQFTVTWDAAVALIDRGLPFALLTVDPGTAHLQAVVGYDEQRGSFLVRDPSVPVLVEIEAEALFASQKAYGPQGLVLVPAEEASRLEGAVLPEAALHDGLYRMQRALLRHDRPAAAAELERLEAAAGGSVATIQAQRALASYDGNQTALLAAFDRMLALQPSAPVALLARLSCLEGLARPEERRRELAAAAQLPGSDPIFGRLWAEELVRDARQAPMAELWLGIALRRRPQDASSYALLAVMAESQTDLPRAHRLQRLAACLDDMNEACAGQYFRYALALGLREEGVRFLRERVDRLGRRSALPWQTLFEALWTMDRPKAAFDLLEEARAVRPDDGELALFAAWAAVRAGQAARAQSLLAEARGRVREAAWLRAAAQIDRLTGERAQAITRWQEVLAVEPLAVDAHAALASLRAETEGRPSARAHLRTAAARHPHHSGLCRLLVEFTDAEADAGLEAIDRLLVLCPTDSWAHRERALRLARRGRTEEALAAVEQGAALEPDSPAAHAVRGFVLAAAARKEAARESFRQALARAADYAAAVHGLLDLADDAADRLRAVRFLEQELRRQVVFGDGLRAYRRAARGLIPDPEILAFLEEARRARPDLLDCWLEVVEQRLLMQDLEAAGRTAAEAAEHFPLMAAPLLALAEVEERRGDGDARRAALERCLEIEPGHSTAALALAEHRERGGDRAAARELLEAALRRAPLDFRIHGLLAEHHARGRERDAAFAALRRALELEPDYDWAWERLADWANLNDALAEALAVADAVTAARRHSAAAHLGRARLLAERPDGMADALAATLQALACEPGSVDAHDRHAAILLRLGRAAEALEACRPAVFGDSPPLALRGRRAWVLAQQGDRDQAILEMEKVVADHPGYLFGLARLGEWYRDRYQWRAARTAYERMLELAPRHADAAYGLFDACYVLGDLPACERVLAEADAEEDAPDRLSRQVQLFSAMGRRPQALEAFRRLCAAPQLESLPVLEAAKTIARHRRRRVALRVLEEAVGARRSPDAAPSGNFEPAPLPRTGEIVGAAWAELATGLPAVFTIHRLRRLLLGGPAAEAAAAAYLEALAESGRWRSFGLIWLVLRGVLRRATRVWGAVGYGFVQLHWRGLAARWMADHAHRLDARPWMLNNLVIALHLVGRSAEAAAVSRRALTLSADHATELHRRWLAWDTAREGQLEEARALLAACSAPGNDVTALLHALTGALLAAEQPAGPRPLELVTSAETENAAARSDLGRRLIALTRQRLG